MLAVRYRVMIAAIDIGNLRGIRSGRLAGLAPFTILTGPNACGKSTVLDALLIATSPTPGDAVGRAVKRHPQAIGGAAWLFRDPQASAELKVETAAEDNWMRQLDWHEDCDPTLRDELRKHDGVPPFSMISSREHGLVSQGLDGPRGTPAGRTFVTAFDVDNLYLFASKIKGEATVNAVRLVDPGLPVQLQRQFSVVSQDGPRKEVEDLLEELVPDFEHLEILVERNNRPFLAIRSRGRSVPVALSGDGIQAFVQMALEIAIEPDGLVLLEEPEVYQHPKAIRQIAGALLANMRRGVQSVLTTHSLELIDALLSEASEEDLEQMALFNLRLDEGMLVSSRRAGDEMAFARQDLEKDLR